MTLQQTLFQTDAVPDVWDRQGGVVCRSEGQVITGVLEAPLSARHSHDFDLRRQCRSLQSAYEGRGMVMAVAGHDLRQPLQVISMVLERLAPSLPDGRDQSWLAIANGEIARLAAGLDQLAVLSRDDDTMDGGPPISETPIDAILADVTATWRHHADAKGLRLRTVPSGLAVLTNARLLSVIIGNLVSNAIKYTDQGGVVVGCRRRGDEVTIEVTDTGRGFAHSTDEAFSPFWREDNDQGGLGLGLTIVRRTADLLGHGIAVRSERSRGSSVAVTAMRIRSPG